MKQTILAAMLAATCLGAPAIAADMSMPVKTPAPAPYGSDWLGFYAGLHVGYGWGRDPFEQPFTYPTSDVVAFTFSGIDSKGFVAGGHFGYNYQFGSFVGGLEIDLSSTEIKASRSGTARRGIFIIGLGMSGTDTVTASRDDKFDLLGSARGRLGFLPMPNWLFYATGGPAWTQFTQGISEVTTSIVPEFPFASTSTSSSSTPMWRFGWAAGAGVEAKVGGNWLVRVEYLHYDFGTSPNFASTSTTIFLGTTSTSSSSLTAGRLTAEVVRTGVSYKF